MDELCTYESNENNAWEIHKAGFAFIENPVGACGLQPCCRASDNDNCSVGHNASYPRRVELVLS